MFTHCQRCGRQFSRPRPYDRGRRCRARVTHAIGVLRASGSPVAEKAADALELQAAVRIPLRRIAAWRIASEDGKRSYIATPQGCNCRHVLLHSKLAICHHRIVAAILAA